MPKANKQSHNEAARQRKGEVDWRDHDTYDLGVSFNRIVTRSQTGFLRLKISDSDLELFCTKEKHQPPGKPHVMEILKGKYGSIPRTIITRSYGKNISESKELEKELKPYKDYKPKEEDKEEVKEEKEEVKKEDENVSSPEAPPE